jgi:hypothetical protein
MPIKEEPVRIEFQYEQEDANTSDGIFNVEYFAETQDGKEKKYVKVTPHGETEASVFELDFLVEVVDFLRKKGVVDRKAPEVIEEVSGSSLKLPTVQLAGGSKTPAAEMFKQHVTPMPIDITKAEDTVNPAYVPVGALAPPVVNGDQLGGPKVIAAPKVISAETAGEMPIINRPVIRTRIGEREDPMVAIEQARMQRKQNPAKAIKRSEAEDEV